MTEEQRLAALKDIDETIERIQALLDFANGKQPKTAGQKLAEAILSKAQPSYELGASHGGNWPAWAVAAIEVEAHHRDFGNRSSGKTVHYFASEEEADNWISEEWAHIANIDFAYSVQGIRYGWDLGPEVRGNVNLG